MLSHQPQFTLSPFFSHSCALFCTLEISNSFPFNRLRTLCQKHLGWGSLCKTTKLIQRESSPSFNFQPSTLQPLSHSMFSIAYESPFLQSLSFHIDTKRPAGEQESTFLRLQDFSSAGDSNVFSRWRWRERGGCGRRGAWPSRPTGLVRARRDTSMRPGPPAA